MLWYSKDEARSAAASLYRATMQMEMAEEVCRPLERDALKPSYKEGSSLLSVSCSPPQYLPLPILPVPDMLE